MTDLPFPFDRISGFNGTEIASCRQVSQDLLGLIERMRETNDVCILTRHGQFMVVLMPVAPDCDELEIAHRFNDDAATKGLQSVEARDYNDVSIFGLLVRNLHQTERVCFLNRQGFPVAVLVPIPPGTESKILEQGFEELMRDTEGNSITVEQLLRELHAE